MRRRSRGDGHGQLQRFRLVEWSIVQRFRLVEWTLVQRFRLVEWTLVQRRFVVGR